MAADYPFREIVGVEYSPALHATAERNIANYRNDTIKCSKIKSVLADATRFTIPSGPVVLYFANPFDETVLEPVVQNVLKSLRDEPRELFVVYYVACHAAVFRRLGFREIWSMKDDAGTHLVLQPPEANSAG